MKEKRFFFRVREEDGVPLYGAIAFGVIDRGTNLIQVRPRSGCVFNCVFCSVDEGPFSKTRQTIYEVDREYLVQGVEEVVKCKGVEDVEVHIDGAGEPFLYSEIKKLIKDISRIDGVKVISAQTRGTLIKVDEVEELDKSGLSRLNLSIDSLNEDLAKKMVGSKVYNLRKVLDLAEEVVKSGIDLLIAPVWVPGLNDPEIERVIEYALKVGAGKKWPGLGIQKYEVYKLGRKVKGVKPWSWFKFYRVLRTLEKKYGAKLVLRREDFGIHKTKWRVPIVFKRFEKVSVEVVGPGWVRGEVIAVGKGRVVSVVNCEAEVGEKIRVKVLTNKDGIYLAEPL